MERKPKEITRSILILAVIFLSISLAFSAVAGFSFGVDSGRKEAIRVLTRESTGNNWIADNNSTIKAIPLEDRFANLMESLSDNHTMRYDVDIQAKLFSDDEPDEVNIILHLKKEDYIK